MIYFLGDVHGHFDHVLEIVTRDRPDGVVFLGDVQAQRPLEVELASILSLTEIWFIHGNHDTDTDADYDHLFGSKLAHRNLHGRVVEIAGVRVAGLGGVFRGRIWCPPQDHLFESQADFLQRCGKGNRWRGGLMLKHRSSIFPSDCAGLARQRADILVTHEAPSAHANGFGAIDELARSMEVGLAIHGHHHVFHDYRAQRDELGFNAIGVGFCGVVDQDGRVIRPGDYDSKATNRSTPQA